MPADSSSRAADTVLAARIPWWQRQLLRQIQTLSADHTRAAQGPPGVGSDAAVLRRDSDLRYLHNQRLDCIRRADILGVPGAWIDFARAEGDAAVDWRDDARFPAPGPGARRVMLERLYDQLAVIGEMAVVDAERRARPAMAYVTDIDGLGPDNAYQQWTFRRNMNQRWMLAATYADAIAATGNERDQLWATATAARTRLRDTAAAMDRYSLERRWETFAADWFGTDAVRLTDTLEPDPATDPGHHPGTRTGFPTPYTVVAQVDAERQAHRTAPAHPGTDAVEVTVPADVDRTWTDSPQPAVAPETGPSPSGPDP
ncbi:hypothetical protein BJY24_005766 [Nocardia transvalensis]|uniref:Uncharacterized protein n=1 Tax=Nocardia transvalensis TaxID=37333 RepID=A0A7W9PIL7_9NOCA|nr:hypothetical protein [Nocardia transvalensis]MBB5916854.1 hypothetical protein [Nocardia transvalensis]